MSPSSTRQWIYQRRPVGALGPEHYELVTVPLPVDLGPDELLIEADYFSVDPYMRIQQAARPTWEPAHPLGVVQGGDVVGRVRAVGTAASQHSIREGDWVLAHTGWREFARCHVSSVTRLDPTVAPVTTALGVLGMPGRTAWFGLMEAGCPRPGETLVVSGAAGAVGSLVVQFGLRAGCRVVGIAGGPEKCRFVEEVLGADAAVDYRAHADAASLQRELARVMGGVDIYFDNVGGLVTDAVIPLFNLRARGVICGQISQYDGGLDAPTAGPRWLHHLLFQRAKLTGVLARDYTHRMAEYTSLAAPWVRARELVLRETIVESFERLPEALATMLRGGNLGKMLVRKAA